MSWVGQIADAEVRCECMCKPAVNGLWLSVVHVSFQQDRDAMVVAWYLQGESIYTMGIGNATDEGFLVYFSGELIVNQLQHTSDRKEAGIFPWQNECQCGWLDRQGDSGPSWGKIGEQETLMQSPAGLIWGFCTMGGRWRILSEKNAIIRFDFSDDLTTMWTVDWRKAIMVLGSGTKGSQ